MVADAPAIGRVCTIIEKIPTVAHPHQVAHMYHKTGAVTTHDETAILQQVIFYTWPTDSCPCPRDKAENFASHSIGGELPVA